MDDIRFIETDNKKSPAPQQHARLSRKPRTDTSGNNNQNVDNDETEESPSIHRAFIYSLALPGYGDAYSGATKRATITYCLLTVAMIIFFWSQYSFVTAFSAYSDACKASSSTDPWDFFLSPALMFALGAGGLYIIWMAAMLSSVETSRNKRKETGLKPQNSSFWALFMTYLCPGSGHMYMGKKEQAYIICGLSVLSAFLVFPVLPSLAAAVMKAMSGNSLSASSMSSAGAMTDQIDAISAKVSALGTYITLSFGTMMGMAVQYYAIADTADMASKYFIAGMKKIESKLKPLLLVTICGYLYPGCGQILAGRKQTGWIITASIIGFKVFVALLVNISLIARESAGTWLSIPSLVGWIALIEAPVRLALKDDD